MVTFPFEDVVDVGDVRPGNGMRCSMISGEVGVGICTVAIILHILYTYSTTTTADAIHDIRYPRTQWLSIFEVFVFLRESI